MKIKPICGYEKCVTSTGIHDGLTHGWGKLDCNGFWQYECPEQFGLHVHEDNEILLGTAIAAFLLYHPDYNSQDFLRLEYSELGQGDA